MLRTISALLPAIGSASAAGAATLSVTPDKRAGRARRTATRETIMRSTLGSVLAALSLASAASATSLSVIPDKLTYYYGETITLSVSGDALGATSGATSYGIFGQLKYTGSGAVTTTSQTQKSVGVGWLKGTLSDGALYSDAFNQIAGLNARTATSLPAVNPFATITLLATGLGLVNVNWNTATGSGFELDFFGLTNAPGTWFIIRDCDGEIGCPPVPEPETGALLALGLLALAARRRGRPRDAG
jgi:hypothetical protein